MRLSLETIQEIRRLGERGQDILQVLLSEFTLTKEDSGLLLDVSLADDLPSIADRAGKASFFEAVHCAGNDGRARLEQNVENFRNDGRLRSYRFDCADHPLRYGNGGVLPVVRLDDGEYFCLFYRDAFPVGWNIANGASGSVEEMLNPERTMLREFGEELFACDHQERLVYAFRPGDEFATGFQREALRAWAQRLSSQDFANYTRVPTPLKWIEGPDRIRVRYGKHTQTSAGCFVNITPGDNAIEVDRVALTSLQDRVAFFDGEFTHGLLYNRVVGLFQVQRTLRDLEKAHFEPDRVFYNAAKADLKELDQLVSDYLHSLGNLRSLAEISTYRATPHKFDLCPITRVMLRRYEAWLKEEEEGSRPEPGEFPPPVVAAAGQCQVFVSHRPPDHGLARWVAQELEARGCRVFLCVESLPRLGESDYAVAIDRALERATCLIVVGTKPEHFDSGWVGYEWRSFLNEIRSGRKPWGKVFTFAGDVQIQELPFALRNVQMIPYSPLSPQDSFEGLYQYISQALKKNT
jgi:hypothetical protein